MALSKLGSVYHKVLKVPQRAKDNFLRCIQLAMSLHPRTFDDEGKSFSRCIKIVDGVFVLYSAKCDYLSYCMVFRLEWFREAKRLLEVYQDKIKKEEDEKYQQERAKVSDSMKKMLRV